MRYRVPALLAAALLCGGCATGSYIITGTPRAPVSAKTVQVYSILPEKFEIIGRVNAFYGQGAGQPATDACVAELRRQAGKIGANGLVFGTLSSTNGQTYLSMQEATVFVANAEGTSLIGTAIYVLGHQ